MSARHARCRVLVVLMSGLWSGVALAQQREPHRETKGEADTLRILGERGSVDTTGVFHCFSGDVAALERALATGYYVSIPGIVSFPKASELRVAAAQVPVERLLVETDSPYLAPTPFRGKRNEPAHVKRVVEVVAEARGVAPGELARTVSMNFHRLFRP